MPSPESSSLSRFKPFKFAQNSDKPPPLPPKDPIHLNRAANPSQASLFSPADNASLPPASPISPSIQYAIRRANSPSPSPFSSSENNHMNPEAASLVSPPPQQQQSQPQGIDGTPSSSVGTGSVTRQTQMSSGSKKDKALAFLKFPKRSPRTPPAIATSNSTPGEDAPDPPPPQEDDGISLPWNFQHNIHVDEGYSGIPPSWSTSLASAGFTEEEIKAIQARRAAGARSPPDLRYLYTERPNSPAVTASFPFPVLPIQQSQPQTPVLTHPAPRSTSLSRLVSLPSQDPSVPLPPIPTLTTSTPVTRVPPPKRKPPLSPMALEAMAAAEEEGQKGHKPSQASTSTYSSDSQAYTSSSYHNQTTTTFSGLNNSTGYKYNPAYTNASSSNLSSQTTTEEEEDDKTPLALAPLRLRSESSFASTAAGKGNVNGGGSGGGSRFKVVNGGGSAGRMSSEDVHGTDGGGEIDVVARQEERGLEEKEKEKEKKSIWGMKIIKAKSIKDLSGAANAAAASASASTPNLPFITFGLGSSSQSTDTQTHKKDPSISTSTSYSHSSLSQSHSVSQHSAPSSSSSASTSMLPSMLPSMSTSSRTITSSWKTSASSLAHASSSLAGGVVSKGSSLVGAVKSSAGRGVLKVRGVGGSLKKSGGWVPGGGKDKERSGEGMGVIDSGSGLGGGSENTAPEDEEFLALDESPQASAKPTVWELYTRPRASTDAGNIPHNINNSYTNPNASTHSLASDASGRTKSQSQSQSGAGSGSMLGPTSLSNLRRQFSNAKSKSQTSLHSQRSQGSLRSQGQGGSSSNNTTQQGGSGLRPHLGQHKHSGSMTSLESIPEASPAPGAVLGGSRFGSGRGKQAMAAWGGNNNATASSTSLSAPSNVHGASSSAASASTSQTQAQPASQPSPHKKAPAQPPRLSLHQHTVSSDLSSWSDALLTGISLSGGGELDLDFGGFGLDKDNDKDRVKESEKNRWEAERYREPKSAPASAVGATRAFQHQQQLSRSGLGLEQGSQSQSSLQIATTTTASLSASASTNMTTTTTATTATTAKGISPARPIRKPGQPLPSSKPPPRLPVPSRPIPPIALSNSTGASASSSSTSLPMARGPVGQVAAGAIASRSRSNSRSGSGSVSGSGRDSPAPLTGVAEPASTARFMPATPFSPQTEGLLSPPPSAWSGIGSPGSAGAGGVTSPAGSSLGPDSAQLWNEIEQMMDPGMMSAIPGLHLSIALPPGAQGVLRSAGIGGGFGGAAAASHGHGYAQGQVPALLPLPPVGVAALAIKSQEGGGSEKEQKTVGDIVGTSPALTETFSATLPFTPEEDSVAGMRKIKAQAGEGVLGTENAVAALRGRTLRDAVANQETEEEEDEEDEEDEDGSSGSDYGEDGYGGIEDGTAEHPQAGRSMSRERGSNAIGNLQHARLLSVSREREDLMALERDPNRDSSRSRSSTLTVTAITTSTMVRRASVARMASAYVIDNSKTDSRGVSLERSTGAAAASRPAIAIQAKRPPSPLSSTFGSEESGGSGGSASSSSPSQEQPTPTTDGGLASPLMYYLDGTQSPSPTPDKMTFDRHPPPPRRLPGAKDFQPDYDEEEEVDYPDEATMAAAFAAGSAPTRPTIVINDGPLSSKALPTASTSAGTTPLSPFQLYRGWLSAVVAPLEEFIDEAVDPREHYLDLREIAEGESGSVFAASLNSVNANKLRLPPLIKAQDNDEIVHGRVRLVAIKSVAIVPSGSPKLVDLQRELSLMRGLWHENVLGMDGVYVDLVEDSLWVRMELMERSLADIIGLIGDGLMLQDRMIGRFARDVLCALEYLQKHNIAHRDVRSDNLLLNKHGVLKLADFSNAVQVTRDSPMRSDIVGVAFWQASLNAPEVRKPPYNALKVDVWSLGATVWEMAQTEPPFADTQQLADRWPPLRQPELYSPAFHDFLQKCSEPAGSRPTASDLLQTSFIHNACGRPVIVQLLSQCMAIEQSLQEGNTSS